MSVVLWVLASAFLLTVLVLEGILVYWRERKWRELEASLGTNGNGRRVASAEADGKVKRVVQEVKVLEARTTRLYYLAGLASSLAIGLIQFLDIAPWLKYGLNMLLIFFSLTAAFILLRLWRSMEDEKHQTVLDQLHLAWEYQQRQATRSLRDELTGLYNREFFALRLSEEVRRQIRHGGFLSCLILEIAGWSDFSHLCGAEESNRLLQRTGQVLKQNVRAEDVVCRYEESQFAVVLIECPQMHADTVASRVSNNLEILLFERICRERGVSLRFLVGTASFPEDGDSAEELLARAEASLRVGMKVQGEHRRERC
jgi:diguanylate cyclase (GGDEF)-like protein